MLDGFPLNIFVQEVEKEDMPDISKEDIKFSGTIETDEDKNAGIFAINAKGEFLIAYRIEKRGYKLDLGYLFEALQEVAYTDNLEDRMTN